MAEQRWLDEVLANVAPSKDGSPKKLPTSVRNAPPEMRAAIRRKQNSESAKRSRERKKAEELALQEELRKQKERLIELEKRMLALATIDQRRKKRNCQAVERRARAKAAQKAKESTGQL